jgi:hypothetical protein
LPQLIRFQGSLPMSVSSKCLCHLTHLISGLGPLSLQAFLVEGPVVPFDKTIVLGMMRITEHHRDSERVARAHQGSRQVTALGRSYRSRVSRSMVMEEGKPWGAECLCHRRKTRSQL